MKKKIFAILLTLILVVSMFASVPVLADEANSDEVGGLDFYSITLHYDAPVLVSYYETKIEVVNEKGKKEKVAVKYFYNTDAESDEGKFVDSKNNEMRSDKLVIPAGTKTISNFYQVSAENMKTGMWYSKLPYKNAFLTHILDASGICTTGKVDLFGITEPYDDAPYEHKNPNIQYADDGYALSTALDSNGNNLKIDVNGYLVDTSDLIWKTSNDERVELYTQIPVVRKTGEKDRKGKPVTEVVLSDEYEWVPFDARKDENGNIVDIQSLQYKYMITDEEFDAFLESEDNVKKLYRATNDEAYDDATNKGKYIAYVLTCLVDKNKDASTYWNTDRVFTSDDLVRDANGYVAYATPRVGTPLLNIKVKDITVEIDALGAQTYDDLASDPQQNNTITVSINDCKYNSDLTNQWFSEGLYTQEEYDALAKFVVGTAKSQTTRTEINLNKNEYKDMKEYGYSPTVKSISLGASDVILSKLPTNAKIYVDFSIKEHQPAEAWNENYQKKMISKSTDTNASTVITEKIDLLTDEDKPKAKTVVEDNGLPIWVIVLIAVGGVILVAAIVVVILIISKKKKA